MLAMVEPLIRTQDLGKDYLLGSVPVHALRGASIRIDHGEMVAVMGASGSGKSTLLHLLGCLDRPTRGEYWLAGRPIGSLDGDTLADIRNRKIGFVFQSFNLLSRTTAIDNVALPLVYAGVSTRIRHERARAALAQVGLGDREGHFPNQLSGGQQQRVAIARALVTHPALILADEPTGSVETQVGLEIMATFQCLNRSGITIVVVTHDETVAAQTQRVITLRDGHIIADGPNPEPVDTHDGLGQLSPLPEPGPPA
jgi:putative ABC transport system ATP-binding protein